MMKQFSRREILLINIMVIVVGLVLDLVGLLASDALLRALLESIGTGLIATGGVNFLDRILVERENGLQIVSWQRSATGKSIYNKKYEAEKVDILGITLDEVLEEIVSQPQKMLYHIFHHRARLRLLFLHPDAKFLEQRAMEDRMSRDAMRARQLLSVERSVIFYKFLKKEYEKASRNQRLVAGLIGSVDIKLVDICPYISIFRVDDEMYWGIYTSDVSGRDLPLFLANDGEKKLLFGQIKQHFYAQFSKGLTSEDNYLVKLNFGPPVLNTELVEALLGAEKVKKLLA
ncbi:MAG: hypothetical protein WA821_05560 [Anaerolineales bacterium]